MTAGRITTAGLSKKFCPGFRRSLLYAVRDIVGELLPRRRRKAALRPGEFWALRDVSIELGAGEALAVIGHNGAGKTTLLKLLHGLLRPDEGSLRVDGRVVALIELGTGLNPLLTARENISMAASLHGLSRADGEAMVPAALDFAELPDSADTVLQSLSTGMRSRLAYAIATQLQPQVMLVDEVLAVGDLAFQRKCILHMQGFLAGGGSLLLVSHALHHIQAICTRGILLDHGRVLAQGGIAEVIHHYLTHRPAQPEESAADVEAAVIIENIALEPAGGGAIASGSAATLVMSCSASERIEVYIGFGVWSEDGWTCVTTSFEGSVHTLQPGRTTFTCEIPTLPLVGGRYRLNPLIFDSIAHARVPLGGRHGQGVMFTVTGATDKFGNAQRQIGQLVVIDADWRQPTRPRREKEQAETAR